MRTIFLHVLVAICAVVLLAGTYCMTLVRAACLGLLHYD